MPIYVIEGKRVSAAKPLSDAEIDEIAESIRAEDSEKRGIYPGLARGTRQFFSDIQTSVGSIFGGEEAALAGIKRGEEIARERGTGASLEELKRQYEREGALSAAGEVARSIPEEIAAQAPQIAATMAAGAAGSAAGAALGGPAAPITSVIGGTIGVLTPSYLQAYAANIERQAQEDIAAGREVDVSRALAAAAAGPQAALDVASQFLVVGRIVGRRVFGEATEEVYDLLRKGDRARAERVAREGLTKTIAKGTAVGVAAEVPTEVVQSALERAQAGLSITSDDAFKEYGEAAYKAGLASPLGTVGRLSERAAARREVAAAEPDLTQETEQERIDAEKEREREAAPPPAPLPKSMDEAPPEVRKILETVDTPKKAVDILRSYEVRLANLSEDLADPKGMEEAARSSGLDPIDLEDRLISAAERLKSTIPFIKLRLGELSGTPIGETPAPSGPVAPIPQSSAAQQQLIEPPAAPPEGAAPAVSVTPTTPVPAIPQTAAAQQTLQIDQTVAEGLGLPGAEVAPKTQPFTVTTTTAAPPVAPISQEATAQQNLGMETTEFVDPVYLQAVDTVVKTGKPTIPALQKALGIGFNRAAKLLEQMEVEGVVTPKDKKTGKRKITMGQTQEAPSVTTEAAPRVAEQTQFESVGRGVAVPPQGLEPAGRDAEVTTGEGLGAAPRVPPDVVVGETRVEPALAEPAPALPSTPEITETETAPKRRGVVPAAPVMPRRDVEAAAADVVRGWTNAPEVVVLDDENDTRVPKGVKIDPSDKGFYHEGKTYVIASRASDTADVHATVYHESLGHFGIRQRFRSRLNEMLNDIYNTNPAVKAAADAIKTTGMSNAQAVEEVLAARSEAGPIKEAGIRAAFNRVAAFIRRIGRAMGIRFAYSNNDVTQIIRLSQEKVIKGRREVAGVRSVAEAKKIERNLVNLPVKKLEELGVLSPDRAEATLAFVEGMSDKLRPFFLALRSMDEMVDIFGQKVPALKGIVKIVKRRATKLRELREEIGNNINRWNSILSDKQYQGAIINKFYSVAIESTERQIDFRRTVKLKNGTVVPNKAYNSLDPLTNKFESLPEPLKKVYFEMLEAYQEMSNRYLDLITKNLPPTAANILRREIESRRLKIYFPLYREGDYWIRYQDKNNETVVEAYPSRLARLEGIRELRKAGIKGIQQYSKVEDAMEAPGMGTFGFFNKVNSELDKFYKDQYGPDAQIPGQLKQTLYKLFLDTIPASSVRQQFRKREGYKGAEKDMLRVYATVASRMANQLTNLEFSPEIDEAAKLVREDVAKDETMATQQVESEINKRLNFLRDPTNNYWINKAVFLTYFDFIMGNISSAVANTTNLSMVVYPLLGAEYGYSRASEVMQDSIAMFMQGGWDRGDDPNAPRKFPSADRTMFDPAKIPPNSPLGRLFIEAVKQGAIKHSVGYDIMQARDREAKLNDYMGMWNDTKQLLGWTFQNTERFNREVALVSAFRLEMEKAREQGRTGRAIENAAIDKAIRLANEANGETLTELSPRVFQTGLLRVVLTFKRFARAMYALQLKLLRDALVGSKTDTTGMSPQDKAEAEAADRQFRQVAIKQWLGTLGGAFTFAGVSGLPFYGLASSLGAIASAISAAMFGEADDEIEDKEEDLKQAMGVWAYKGPVNQIFGIDLASRTGFTGMFWRDDPRRIDEIGLEYFAIEQFLGPAWASARSRFDAIRDFQAGHLDRAIEKTIPVFARNVAKTIRYGMEGAQTKDGKPIVDDLNAYQLVMQAFGFAPTEISEASARAGARKEIVKKVTDRRQALFESAYAAWSQGDQEGYINALRDISKWNKTKTAAEFKATIDWDELEQSFRGRSRAAEEALDGVSIPKRYREGAVSRVPN